MNEDDYKKMQKEMDEKLEKEWNDKFETIADNPKPSIEDLWILPEEYFYRWRRKYDYPKLVESFNKSKPNFVKWKSEYNITDDELVANLVSPFLQSKSLSKDKDLYLLEQTFDGIKRLIVAHADLSAKEVMFPERGEAYVIIKKFKSYSDWCDKNEIEFDLFTINRRQAPNHELEQVWLDTGYELLKMGGRHPPVNAFRMLLEGSILILSIFVGSNWKGQFI